MAKGKLPAWDGSGTDLSIMQTAGDIAGMRLDTYQEHLARYVTRWGWDEYAERVFEDLVNRTWEHEATNLPLPVPSRYTISIQVRRAIEEMTS